jgi:hypothetical protein
MLLLKRDAKRVLTVAIRTKDDLENGAGVATVLFLSIHSSVSVTLYLLVIAFAFLKKKRIIAWS